jgi:hypothetical protein
LCGHNSVLRRKDECNKRKNCEKPLLDHAKSPMVNRSIRNLKNYGCLFVSSLMHILLILVAAKEINVST